MSTPSFPNTPPSGLLTRLPRPPPDLDAGIAYSTLLAHYYNKTSLTMAAASPFSESRHKIWRQDIPFLAHQYPAVSHGIAAVAALHIWCERVRREQPHPSTSQQLQPTISGSSTWEERLTERHLHQAMVHHGECLKHFQPELRSVSQDNVEAVISCALLLIPFGIANSQVQRRSSQSQSVSPSSSRTDYEEISAESDEPTSASNAEMSTIVDLNWIFYLRGISSVRATALEKSNRPEESSILSLLQRIEDDWDPGLAISSSSDLESSALQTTIIGEGPAAISQLQDQLQSTKPCSNRQICLQALQPLQFMADKQFTAGKTGTHRFLLSWISDLDNAFVDLLTGNNIFAMAIYAHFLVYAVLHDHRWWIGDLGVANIRDILGSTGDLGCCEKCDGISGLGRQQLFAWPARILELCEGVGAGGLSGMAQGYDYTMT